MKRISVKRTLGFDGEEGPIVNTYEYYFSQFDAYGVNKANTFGNTEILSLSSKENGPSEV